MERHALRRQWDEGVSCSQRGMIARLRRANAQAGVTDGADDLIPLEQGSTGTGILGVIAFMWMRLVDKGASARWTVHSVAPCTVWLWMV
jgi:hypothetical protein